MLEAWRAWELRWKRNEINSGVWSGCRSGWREIGRIEIDCFVGLVELGILRELNLSQMLEHVGFQKPFKYMDPYSPNKGTKNESNTLPLQFYILSKRLFGKQTSRWIMRLVEHFRVSSFPGLFQPKVAATSSTPMSLLAFHVGLIALGALSTISGEPLNWKGDMTGCWQLMICQFVNH